MGKLENKVALITGSGSGFGRAIAYKFAKEGAKVMLNGINEELVKNTCIEMQNNYDVDYVVADVSIKADVLSMVDQVISRFGRIDILVNNAGGRFNIPREVEAIEEEHWNKVLNVNLKGTFLTSQAAVRYMKESGGGKIINMASLAGRTGTDTTDVAYASAKGGIISFTRKLAREMGPYGINVNVIAPGVIISGERLRRVFYEDKSEQDRNQILNQIALGGLGENEDIANVALFLAAEDSRYITGAVMDVNGGRFMG
jgi:NAD(P)-dependent dehydrogenase (short-subunit alcohol dehydrogenase family)